MFEPILYADVLLPLPIPNLYTYEVELVDEDKLKEGIRVSVPFGSRKIYTGIVWKIHKEKPKAYNPKLIRDILDTEPVINLYQRKLWKWIASYYMCHLGEVMNAALPASMKMSSDTKLVYNPNFGSDYKSLNDAEFMVAQALESHKTLSVNEAVALLNRKSIYSLLQSMLSKNVISIDEDYKDKYKPRMRAMVQIAENYKEELLLQPFIDGLSNAPKQLELALKYLDTSGFFRASDNLKLSKKALISDAQSTTAVFNALVEKGFFEVTEKPIGINPLDNLSSDLPELNEAQHQVYCGIQDSKFKVDLLHGVTGSGKTEVYIHLIQEVLESGQSALYLLPEIALTAQIITRLKKHFGDHIVVYHSKYSQRERMDAWRDLLENPDEPKIYLGARSALFLPFKQLGLIVVDEEHDSSFKQYDPAPRYYARDCAIVLGDMLQAKVVLGSATPSVETYHNAKTDKYGYHQLTERFGNAKLPEAEIIDLRRTYKTGAMKGLLSNEVVEAMKAALDREEQVIVFQNRRGFSPFVICTTCGYTAECSQCDVGLTYHKKFHYLNCHYCGRRSDLPKECPACGKHTIKLSGSGTEKLEEEIELLFADHKVGRMDLDTTRTKRGHERIIEDFADGDVDILVGTQMVTKGLDFGKVSLVVVVSADHSLSFPDFRANERSFQLMHQVAGRAGRKEIEGKVLIQTFNPEHPVVQSVVESDFEQFVKLETHERQDYFYPPFARLIRLSVRHRDAKYTSNVARHLAKSLGDYLGKERVLGPEFPSVARVRNQYRKNILLKLSRDKNLATHKLNIQKIIDQLQTQKEMKAARVVVDVDVV